MQTLTIKKNRVELNSLKSFSTRGIDFNQILTQSILRSRIKTRRKRLSKMRSFKRRSRVWDQRLSWEKSPPSFLDRRELLTLLLGANSLSLHYVNGRSLTKYGQSRNTQALSPEKRIGKTSPSSFLKQLNLERIRRYKYSAVQIPNIIRAAYVGFYLKNPTLVTQLMAHALPKLQRNRKETKFLRFLRKLAKVVSAARWERLGIKLEFQGRVNRWRRTKRVQAVYGLIPSVVFSSRIEYGSSQAITRKGALAIRLWVVYKPSFKNELEAAFRSYAEYSLVKFSQNTLN